MVVIKSFITEVFYDHFKPIFTYLNEGEKVCECYSRLKLMVEAHLHVGFSQLVLLDMLQLNHSINI